MGKKCQLTNKTFNNGYSVSHSHRRTKKKQQINLQKKKVWSHSAGKWITLKISTKALKSIHKFSL
uniref:ribosomal protein L28 n=1 Tax=Rhodaphanes brevistipitata TaxID=446136 RepID=UPI001FCDE3A1|nr:ribosomal protein L28 [Rhodaphanes brevistipitata]UNJ18386.1 ribosomal protein L28 [Rhodaphanes brevistipitata]